MFNRRQFLQRAGQLGLASSMGLHAPFSHAFHPSLDGERTLNLYNIHTSEHIQMPFCLHGQYLKEGIQHFDLLLRDHRTNQAIAMEHQLYERLYYLQNMFELKQPLYIISGYRSPSSNAGLRQTSTAVAEQSLHVQGKAVDIRIPGVSHRALHRAAVMMRAGGVGYYPKDGFIHIDTGRVRHWQS